MPSSCEEWHVLWPGFRTRPRGGPFQGRSGNREPAGGHRCGWPRPAQKIADQQKHAGSSHVSNAASRTPSSCWAGGRAEWRPWLAAPGRGRSWCSGLSIDDDDEGAGAGDDLRGTAMRRRRWRRSPAKPEVAEVQGQDLRGGMLIGRVGPALELPLRGWLCWLFFLLTRFASRSALRSAPLFGPRPRHTFYCGVFEETTITNSAAILAQPQQGFA